MAVVEIDQSRVEEFVGQVLGDLAGAMNVLGAALGDRLGLFAALAERGPASADELARRTGLAPRYVREWLGGMTAASYVVYDPATEVFALPAEHVPALAEEAGPVFFGGALQEFLGVLPVLDRVAEAFRTGGGVPQSAYPDDFYEGLERFTAGWFEHLLVPVWIPAAPQVLAALQRGAEVADIGCGRGRAAITIAQAFPNSKVVGFDLHAPSIKAAREAAGGVADRVRFEVRDAAQGIPGVYDVITTFDVVHDAVDPLGLLRAIRKALAPDGTYLCLDINCSHRIEENVGPLGSVFHGFSLMYCMTTSLSQGGEGLGTVGLHEPKLQELAAQAGFSSCRKLPLENPFNSLYELRA